MNSFWKTLLYVLILFVTILMALQWGAVDDANEIIILELRLPRVLSALAVGLGLAVSGVGLQTLFRNPLCDPYLLGVSSGAALGAVLGPSSFSAPLLGIVGAFLFTLVLLLVARSESLTGVLITGVILGFLGSGLIALKIALSDPAGLNSVLPWLFGNLGRPDFSISLLLLVVCLTGSLLIWLSWKRLDALLLNPEEAESLGINVKRERIQLIVLVSTMTAVCVSFCGMIGFVGLVIPHLARVWVGPLHRNLIAVSAWLGAVTLISADLLSRWVLRPVELPIGVVTSLLGIPVFLWLTLGRRKWLL